MKNIVTLAYRQDLHCEAPGPDGTGVFPIDSAMSKGRPGAGFSPLDLLALAHGSCTAMMLAKAAEGLGLDVRGTRVEVAQEYDAGPPMRLTSVHIRFHLPCRMTAEQEAKLRAGAELCPVHTALRPDVRVEMKLVQAG